jgi:hypothetical protein
VIASQVEIGRPTENAVHMTGLSVRADDSIQLLRSQREEFVQVPTRSSGDCAGADENGRNQRSGPHVERDCDLSMEACPDRYYEEEPSKVAEEES